MGQHDVGKRMDFVGEVRWSERAGRTTRTDAGLVKKSCTYSRLQDNISPGLGVSENQNVRARMFMLPSSVDMMIISDMRGRRSERKGKRFKTLPDRSEHVKRSLTAHKRHRVTARS